MNRGRGMYRRSSVLQRGAGVKGRSGMRPLPEYLEQDQVERLIEAAPHGRARLVMLEQWRAGLRISEALALEPSDLSLESETPTLKVPQGKGHRPRIVPVHPELGGALRSALSYGNIDQSGPIISAHRSTAWRWIRSAFDRCVEGGSMLEGRRIGTHTLRHSFARHMLANGIPLNHLSLWLGHSSIATTLIYLQLLPDPSGMIQGVP